MSWPWPRMYQTRWRTLLIAEDVDGEGRLLNLKWVNAGYWVREPLLSLGDISLIDTIDVADFGPFYVLCIHDKDGTDSTISFYPGSGWQEEDANVCGIGINFNGQFVGARGREVLWSAIGNFEFFPEADRTAGFRSLFLPNAAGDARLVKLQQLGKSVVAYGNNGRIVLDPSVVGNTFVYGEELAYGPGVGSGNHIAGDHRVHGYIDLTGDFWTLEEGGSGPEKRGYREFIKPMLPDAVVSFLPADKRFYISDGHTCLVINSFGAHTIDVMVSSVAHRWDGAIMATGVITNDSEARVTTEWLDYGSRGLKSVESMVASVNQGGQDVMLSVDYRMLKNRPWVPFKWVTGGPRGESGIHVTALDFRLKFRALNYHGIELDGLLANIKYSDQRFKRGSVPEQRESRTLEEALTE